MSEAKPEVNLLDNPKYKSFVESLAAITKMAEKLTLDEERKLSTQFFLSPETVYEPVHKIENVEILGKDQNKILLRIFTPHASEKLPVLIYFHRGGWVFGNVEEADPLCRKIANRLECIVVSVEYRLAPENPFPKPLEDCYAATEWIYENASRFGGDSENLIICGESAGGNLAAAVSLMARDRNGPSLSAQLLIYPVISSEIRDEVFDKCPDKYFISKDVAKFFMSMYAQTPEDANNPYVSVDKAENFKNLPPALIITAEYDPLCVDAEEYAKKLKQAGVPVVTKCFPEVIHAFIDLPIYEETQKNEWIEEIGRLLKTLRSV